MINLFMARVLLAIILNSVINLFSYQYGNGSSQINDPLQLPATSNSFENGIKAKNFHSVLVDNENRKWFLTDVVIESFDRNKWTNLYQEQYRERILQELPITNLAITPFGASVYVATKGTSVTSLYRNNVDAVSGASKYAQCGPIETKPDNVCSIYISHNWTYLFGTDNEVMSYISGNFYPSNDDLL